MCWPSRWQPWLTLLQAASSRVGMHGPALCGAAGWGPLGYVALDAACRPAPRSRSIPACKAATPHHHSCVACQLDTCSRVRRKALPGCPACGCDRSGATHVLLLHVVCSSTAFTPAGMFA